MRPPLIESWLNPFRSRRRSYKKPNGKTSARLRVEQLERRDCPSAPEGNLAPSISQVAFANPNLMITQVSHIQVIGASDVDGDPITFRYDWYLNSQPLRSYVSEVPSDSLDLAQIDLNALASVVGPFWAPLTISVTVTPMDPYQSGTPVTAITAATPTPEQLYANYLAQVSIADQLYQNEIGLAVQNRENGGPVAAQQLYDDYLASIGAARTVYGAAETAAVAEYQTALQPADSIAAARYQSADSIYQLALAGPQSVWEASVEAAQIDCELALAEADLDYAEAIAPYEQAVQSAQENLLANPEDPAAQAALTQAQQDMDSAQVQALAMREEAYAFALSVQLEAEESAYQTLESAIAPAKTIRDGEIAAADQEYSLAEYLAYADALSAETSAQATFVAAELAAWDGYLAAFDLLVAQQPQAEVQYETAKSQALNSWMTREEAASDAYLTALASLEQPPPAGQPQPPPPGRLPEQAPLRVLNVLARNDMGLAAAMDAIDEAIMRVQADPFHARANFAWVAPLGLPLGLPAGDRTALLAGIPRVNPSSLPLVPARWSSFLCTGGGVNASRWGVVPPRTLVGISGASPCVGLILIPVNANHETYVFHFGAAEDPEYTISRYFNANLLAGPRRAYRAVLCGAEVTPIAATNDGSARTLRAVISALRNNRFLGNPGITYVQGPAVAVDNAGRLYWPLHDEAPVGNYP